MAVLSSVQSPPAEGAGWSAIADFQSHTAQILRARPPLSARITLYVLVALVVSLILMATFLSIDRVVVGRGRIASESPRIMVQPLETSVVRAINVREGQIVKAGDVLARLDPTFSTADATLLRRRAEGMEAEIARVKAELASEPYRAKDGDIVTGLQYRIYETRKAEKIAALENFDGQIATTISTIDRARKEREVYVQRQKLMGEVEVMRQTLEANKTGSRLNTIAASDVKLEVERNVAAQTGVIEASTYQLDVRRAERSAYLQKWMSDLAQTLVERQNQLDETREQMAKADRRQELVEMRAPEDAVVLVVGDISVGSVVESAKKMFTLVPVNGGLKVEVEVAARDQGFVKVGQQVELKLDAWPFNQHGTVTGTVRSVSGDSFSLKQEMGASAPTIYMATIDITEQGLRGVPEGFRLIPGMPLSADIVVGEQTMAAYLLQRALPVFSEGMREP